MANKIPKGAHDELLKIVTAHPEGCNTPDIARKLGDNVPRRTLQYRLNQLVRSGQLLKDGSGRWTKYRLADSTDSKITSTTDGDLPEANYRYLIAISKHGQVIRDYVGQAAATRKPVGYNQEFLERYQPNSTFYLDETDRNRLERLGKPQHSTQLAGTYAKLILNRLLIDLTWNSSRLEGNTYSFLDTRRLIEFGRKATGKNELETQMILNHKDAIEFLVSSLDEIDFNSYTFLNLHALLSNNLLTDPTASGRLRYIAVAIEKSVFHPLEVPQRINECFGIVLSKAAEIRNPFEQAFFILTHIPYLQPFDDVNKRVSRLGANIPLIRSNLAPLSFTDVPREAYTDAILGVYELNETALLKDIFVWAYERSAAQYAAVIQSLGAPDPLRLKYRAEIREVVATIIRAKTRRREAIEEISRLIAKIIKPRDRTALTTIIEEELLGLHEGNFARFQVRPSEFQAWQEVWSIR